MQIKNKQLAPRTAFTMVELVIVIAIIAILMAFLLPAVGRAITTARNATVVTEIKNLENGINQFKLKYGVDPPSRFVLYEQGTGGTAPKWDDDGARDLLRRTSVAFIRQAWPNFDFTLDRDFNGDGDSDDFVVMGGAECLLFFLGGMNATEDAAGNQISTPNGPVGTGTPVKWLPLGFSTDPANPFIRTGTRVGPFYEFDSDRIINVSTAANRDMPEYIDPLPSQQFPYLYVSSNGGRGYTTTLDGSGNISGYPDLNLGAGGSVPSMTYIFLESATVTASDTYVAGAVPFNKNSYQIISPGQDREYGVGGLYSVEDGFEDGYSSFTGFDISVQNDNITNFSDGVMRP